MELNDIGDIVGPELAPQSSPPSRVFHPKAGFEILHGEPSETADEDAFYCYLFHYDPYAYVVDQRPGKGPKMPSTYQIF